VLALKVDGIVSQDPRKKHCYRNTGWMGKLEGVKELGYGANSVQLRKLRQWPKLKGTL
jgi:hypothetical protein